MSKARDELNTPVRPPITKIARDPSPKSIGVASFTAERYIVAMKITMSAPNGIETVSVFIVNTSCSVTLMPVRNM